MSNKLLFIVAILGAVILNFSFSSLVFASQTFYFPDAWPGGPPFGVVIVNKTVFNPGEIVRVSAKDDTYPFTLVSKITIDSPKQALLAIDDACNGGPPVSTPTSFAAPTTPGTHTMSFTFVGLLPQGGYGIPSGCLDWALGQSLTVPLTITYRVVGYTLPVVNFLSSKNKIITLGQSVTYSANATDPRADIDFLALNWRNPDGTYNWTNPPGTGSYQATTNIGPYFHYIPTRSSGSFVVTMTPTTVGAYKIYAVAHDKHANKWVRSSKEYTLTVKPPLPDLTAGMVTPTIVTAGTVSILNATITNIGNGSAGRSFTDLFQSADNSEGAGATDIGTYSSASVAAHADNTAVFTHTFSSSGTTYIRVCADKNSSTNTGVVTELSENNNCGAWTRISIKGASCTLPWGGTVTSGSFITAYKNSLVTIPATCLSSSNSQTRTCDDGLLSGSSVYTKESCAVSLPQQSQSQSQSQTHSAPPTLSGTLTVFPVMVRRGSSVPIILRWSIKGAKSLARQSCVINRGVGTSMRQIMQLDGTSPTSDTPIANHYKDNKRGEHIFNHQTAYTLSCGGKTLKTAFVDLVPQYSSF